MRISLIYGVGILLLALLLTLSDSRRLRTESPAPAAPPTSPLTSLPTPPRQAAPWTPPAGVPDTLVSTATVLFQQGLADPRGCEYREIELTFDSIREGARIAKTHGWVLPATADAEQRFAVCWNGLVYPTASVGAPADLRVDVQAMLAADEIIRAAYEKRSNGFPFRRHSYAMSNTFSLTIEPVLPMKACLLLRLDEGMLALDVWTAWEMGVKTEDPYLQLATDWTWALFERAVSAHMTGNDAAVLVDARLLAKIGPLVEAEAANRHFPRPIAYDDNGKELAESPYLVFLRSVPDLIADANRRLKEPPRKQVLEAGVAAYPDKGKRITALIQDLDQVDEQQTSQPGSVSLNLSPIVQALVMEGDDAVEPLLACMETDTRLTRSVSYGRSFWFDRRLIPVQRAAYAAIREILGTREFGPHTYNPNVQIAQIRAYWAKNRGVSPAERVINVLKDETATTEQWLEAAKALQKYAKDPALRAMQAPSVAELLAQRIDDSVVKEQSRGSLYNYNMHRANHMTLALAQWDYAAGKPALRIQIERSRVLMDEAKSYHSSGSSTIQYLASQLSAMYMEIAQHDPQGYLDYAAWVSTLKPGEISEYVMDVLPPLWQHADRPEMASAAEKLFADPRSAWRPLLKLTVGSSERPLVDLLNSPLIDVPAFRQCLLAGLAEMQVVGVAEVNDEGEYTVKLNGNWQPGRWWPARPPAPTRNQWSTTQPVRMADLYAWHLSRLGTMPPIAPYLPQAERDTAIAQCVQALKGEGKHWVTSK
jgi:hypothetical protein